MGFNRYRYIHGNKDSFRFAWHALGREYAMPSRPIELTIHVPSPPHLSERGQFLVRARPVQRDKFTHLHYYIRLSWPLVRPSILLVPDSWLLVILAENDGVRRRGGGMYRANAEV